MELEIKKINVIDVCWTMYRSNTTFDFIKFVISHKGMTLWNKILNLYIIKLIFVFLGRLFNKDIYRYAYIYQLKGMDKNDLDNYAKIFYESVLSEKKIDFTFERMKKLEGESILCSASLDIIVKCISEDIGIPYRSSILGFDNGVCTGLLSDDLLAKKQDLFFGEKIVSVITDNLSDYELLKMAEKKIILSNRKNIVFWKNRELDVSYVYDT